jgi:ABC-type glutathione transport system ATPase component
MPDDLLLKVTGLSKSYAGRRVLDNVSFSLHRGRTLAIVGPSGSGKTTLARCLARFEPPDSGSVTLHGREIGAFPRTAIQLIAQQPAASLNPRFTAAEIVAEPLLIRKLGNREERRRSSRIAMQAVGLDPGAEGKFALDFSGGERQRLALARALVVEPEILILDESLGSLDLSIQAQIANLLLELQERLGIACILISHDLAAVARIAPEIAVLAGGLVVESGATAELLERPRHPVTQGLVHATSLLRTPRGPFSAEPSAS